MDDLHSNLLIIFVKNPRPGKVKTRLAEDIGKKRALEVYRKLLMITHDITDSLHCHRQVWYSDFIDNKDRWEEDKYEKRLQSGNDLGERMYSAFREAFSDGFDKVVIIGSDCAELTQQIIEKAFDQLDQYDVVIGPSRDGGYYLLGMNTFYGDLFAGIPWSTPTVCEQTIGRVKEMGLSLHRLPLLNDIDTEQDMIEATINLGRS